MIKNIIFDLGRVLINYEPEKYIKTFGYDDIMTNKIMNAVFMHKCWGEFDRGTYSFEGILEKVISDSFDLKEDIRKVFKDWFSILTPKEKTVDFLKEVEEKGFKLYILSNFSKEGFEYISKKYDFFKLFDGQVISCYVNYIKPEPEIYQELLNKYNLNAEECLFIDDMKANIDEAEKQNIKGILFENIEQAKKDFYEIIGY